jgi:hypothetical protein
MALSVRIACREIYNVECTRIMSRHTVDAAPTGVLKSDGKKEFL